MTPKRKFKALSWILTLALVFSLFTASTTGAFAEPETESQDVTQEEVQDEEQAEPEVQENVETIASDVIHITDVAGLETLASEVNAGDTKSGVTYYLDNDLELPSNYVPIGTANRFFKGTFDGGMHTVTINFNDTSRDFNGLFGAVEGATIENVIIGHIDWDTHEKDSEIIGGSFTAGVVGYANESTIQCCGNNADVSGANNHTYGKNQGPNDSYVGGIVGYATYTRITSCFNHGDIVDKCTLSTTADGGSQYAGGIAGQLYSASSSAQYCYSTGSVTVSNASYTYAGGIAGMSQTASVMNSYNAGKITGGNFVGGVIGSSNSYYQQNSYSFYLVGTASRGVGSRDDNTEYINSASEDDLKDASSDVAKALGSSFVEPEPPEMNDGFLVLSWENDNAAAGSIYPTEIANEYQLREFANAVRAGHTYEGETVKLMDNINLDGWYSGSDYGNIWTAIGGYGSTDPKFCGTFDGQGYAIHNMVLLNSDSGYIGLFAVLPEGAVVENLELDGIISCTGSSIGSIVGWNAGTVENCTSKVSIEAGYNEYVGGIVGDNAGEIIDCTNGGIINAPYAGYVGGIAGRMEPKYDNDFHDNAVTLPSISGCTNDADISGYTYVGGVVGGVFNDDEYIPGNIKLTYSCNRGNVTGSYETVSKPYTGGLFGYSKLGELRVTHCYTSGDVKGSSLYSGSLAGYSKSFINDTYYPLESMTVYSSGMPDGAGTNRARPVTREYMETDDFVNMVFSDDSVVNSSLKDIQEFTEYSVNETLEDKVLAGTEIDGVYTINIYEENSDTYATVTRLAQAYTQGLSGLTVDNKTYTVDCDAVDNTTFSDDYGKIVQSTFKLCNYAAESTLSVEVEWENISVTLKTSTGDCIGSYTYCMADLQGLSKENTEYKHYSAIERPTKDEKDDGQGNEVHVGVATEYVTVDQLVSDAVTKVYTATDSSIPTWSLNEIRFQPIDWEGNPQYVRAISTNETTPYYKVDESTADWILAIKSWQDVMEDEEETEITPDLADTENMLRLIKATDDKTNETYSNVKWVNNITVTIRD